MAGLNLRANVNTSGVAFAQAPSQAGRTITEQAYGIGSGADAGGSKCAGWGSHLAGIAATALLVYIWYSLPR